MTAATTPPGRFVSFEGVDGAGKTTQLDRLEQSLRGLGVPLVRTREPGGTPLGELLRAQLLGKDMQPLTETLLMFAARQEHISAVIRPALQAGRWILCDRFTDASYAYQGGGRGLARERLDQLAAWVQEGLEPDLTILVDIDPDEARRRRARARAADRFEAQDSAFFDAVRRAYRERMASHPARFLQVDGAQDPAAVAHAVLERLQPWLAGYR